MNYVVAIAAIVFLTAMLAAIRPWLHARSDNQHHVAWPKTATKRASSLGFQPKHSQELFDIDLFDIDLFEDFKSSDEPSDPPHSDFTAEDDFLKIEQTNRERFRAELLHQLRPPLAALELRLEDAIDAAEVPTAVREENVAAVVQIRQLAQLVTDLLDRGQESTDDRRYRSR